MIQDIIHYDILMVKMTKDQKEVWKIVETYTDLIFRGKFEEFLNYLHEDYSGWDYLDEEPTGKKAIEEEITFSCPKVDEVSYRLKPAEIKIFGHTAIVHYHLSLLNNLDHVGADISGNHYTDILIKQNEKWILVGDHISKFNYTKLESRFLLNK